MKLFAILALGAATVTGNPLNGALDQILGEPLAIYLVQPGNQVISSLFPTTTSEAPTSEKPPPTPTSEKPPPTFMTQTITQGTGAPPPPPPADDIPDGQGNNFKVMPGTVRFPWNYGNKDKVVPITPQSENGGWAISPNQMCRPNTWCPYACEPGYYSAQWDPKAKLYNGPGSMNGGLWADGQGKLSKPFKDRPFCAPGMFNTQIRNTLKQPVSACQTIYPGNEAMLIPTVAQPGGTAPLNIVPNTYWLGTSSQFYVNLPGSNNEKCIWGDQNKPQGNWGAYVFGGGQSPDSNTYISVTYNPLYEKQGYATKGIYNVKVVCDSGKCNFPVGSDGKKGCKCEQGKCTQANGCTVTLMPGAKASFVLY